MALNQRFRFLLYLLTFKTGLSAEISVFVRMGSSVEMDIQIQELPEFDDLSWRNEKSEMIVKYTNETKRVKLHPSYKDRVDFNDKTFSLTLKNMQETDSGLYTARASGEKDNDIVTYRVSVIDSVEAPVLTVNSSWFSPDPCSFMCKGGNIIISSIFNSSSCSPEEVTSSDNYTLRLNCSGDSIVCNHSNPVSWKTNIKKANELCTANQKRRLAKEASLQLLWLILLLPIFVGLLALVIKKKEGAQQKEQTVYDEVNENTKSQTSLKTLEKSKNIQTVYDTAVDPGKTDVTVHTKPNNDPNQSSLTEKSMPVASITIYSTIQQQPKPHKTEPDNTVYAVVNKQAVGRKPTGETSSS